MSDKPPPETPPTPDTGRDPPDKIRDLLIEDEMRSSYLRYAMSVIVSRALPDVRDGLKPSQRRILVAMNDLNLGPRSKFRKCAKIAGDTSGNYHPHGESVVYPTLVRMAQPFNMSRTLVDGQGNFGSVDGDPPAAMRYTEARLTDAAVAMLDDLELDTVDYAPNYDDSRTEPTVLPGKFPNLLVNGSIGIAVGMASNIPPHNLGEVVDALTLFIENPDVELAELMQVMPGPDFPTGGLICGQSGIWDAYSTGRGRLTVRAKIRAEEEKPGRWALHIDEIPYPPRRDLIIERIASLVRDGTIDGISKIEDYADRTNPYRIYLKLKVGEDPQVIKNLLYKYTALQDTFGVNCIALVNSRPQQIPLRGMLQHYRDYRQSVIVRRTNFLLNKAQARAHIVEGLLKALDVIDQIIETIRSSPNPEVAQARLIDKFGFSEKQSEAILRMTLARLTGLERQKLEDELKELLIKVAGYQEILGSERKQMEVIIEELAELKRRHAQPRRTEISDELTEFNREELIAVEDMVVTMSRSGYLKRVALDTYRAQARGGRGIIGADTKEEDIISHLWAASTHDTLLFLTTRGRGFAKRVFEIPVLRRQSAGRNINNLLNLKDGEEVTAAFALEEFDDRDLLFVSRLGYVKKVTLSLLRNAARQTGLIACEVSDGDELLGAALLSGGEDVIIATKKGMAIRFSESDARRMGRTARGVRGIRLRRGDEVVGLSVARPGASLLTLCENGYGKRTQASEYRPQTRGGLGLKDIQATTRNGPVIGAYMVDENDEIVLITAQGMVVRTRVAEISKIGRNTQGVRIIKLKSKDRLLAASVVPSNGNGEPGGEVGDPSGEVGAPGGGAADLGGSNGQPDDRERDEAPPEGGEPEGD